MAQNRYFFDFASTTPPCSEAQNASKNFDEEYFGNPSSSHLLGAKAGEAIENARNFFADYFGVHPKNVIFTGSGTESDNLAVLGTAHALLARDCREGRLKQNDYQAPLFACSAVEHPAIRATTLSLKDFGWAPETLPVDVNGQIDEKKYHSFLHKNPSFISIMRVNNIIGTQFPIEDLAKKAKSICPNVIFHSDCVQAFGKVEVPKKGSQVDLISISGHKIEGPKGVGALIVLNDDLLDQGLPRPIICGGSQENGYRSGTQNAGLIAGFHCAAKKFLEKKDEYIEKTAQLKKQFIEGLLENQLLHQKERAMLQINSPKDGVPYVINLASPFLPASRIAKSLEEKGFFVATGSACSSKNRSPDPVLIATGKTIAEASSSIRVSFCSTQNQDDILALCNALKETIQSYEKKLGNH